MGNIGGGGRRDGRSMGKRHLLEEKAAAKDDKYRTWSWKCRCHPDRWNVHGTDFSRPGSISRIPAKIEDFHSLPE